MKNVAIIGSSGAIGNSISKILSRDVSVETVYNFSRSGVKEDTKKEHVKEKKKELYMKRL